MCIKERYLDQPTIPKILVYPRDSPLLPEQCELGLLIRTSLPGEGSGRGGVFDQDNELVIIRDCVIQILVDFLKRRIRA